MQGHRAQDREEHPDGQVVEREAHGIPVVRGLGASLCSVLIPCRENNGVVQKRKAETMRLRLRSYKDFDDTVKMLNETLGIDLR